MTDTTAAPDDQVAKTANAAEAGLHILAALGDLFAGSTDHVALPSRVKAGADDVCFYAAKFRHLGEIGVLLQSMLSNFNVSEVKTLLATVSKQQEDKINEGVSPYRLHTEEIVKAAVGDGSLVAKLLQGATQTLPQLAPMFSNLTAEEFSELDLDEAGIVAYGILAHNYSFFTQRLLPVIAASIASLSARKS